MLNQCLKLLYNLWIQLSETLHSDSVGVTEELDNISRGSAVNADLFWLQLCEQQAFSEGFTLEISRGAVNNQ